MSEINNITNLDKSKKKAILQKMDLQKLTTLFGLIVLCAILSILSPVFLTVANIQNVLLQASINAVIALGMTFVIISAGIDLSVGSVLALCGVVTALLLKLEVNVFLVVIICLGMGATYGMINGILITKGNLPPFIATLGMMSIARGLALIVTSGKAISGFSASFKYIGSGSINGLFIPVIIMVVCYIIAHILLKYTKLGRYTYAIGGNHEGAMFSGINVNKILIKVYMISGITASIGALILTARLNSAQPIAGTGYEMDAIAATVIGGASLAGGIGSVVGTLIGAIIISVLRNGLNLLNVSSYIQQVIIGAVILTAVYADTRKKR